MAIKYNKAHELAQSLKKKKKYENVLNVLENNRTTTNAIQNRTTREINNRILNGGTIAPVYSSDTSSKKTQLNIISEEEQKAKLKTPLELLQEQQQKQFEEKQQKSKEASEKRVEQKKKDEKENRTWFKSGALEDGYDFGDVTKTILGTAGDIGTNILKGVTSAGDSLGKLMAGGVAEFSDLIGQDEYAEKLRNRLAGKDEELNKKIEKFTLTPYLQKASDKLDDSSLTGDKTDSLASSVGQLGASASAQAVGIPWWLVSGGSSAGAELENAYKSGATSGEAWGSALISGASEVAFEKLGGIKFGGKALDTGLKQTLSKQLTNKTAQTLTKFGIDVGTEGVEEVLTEITSNLGKKLTYEDEKTLNEVLFSEEAMDSYLEAFIGGAVLGGGFNVGKTINSAKTGRDYDTGLTQNEQSVIDNVVSQRTTEIQKQKAVEERINKVIEEQEATRGTLTDEAKQEIKNRVMQEDIDYSTSKLSKKEIAKIEEEVRQDLERGEIDIDTIESTLSSEKTARIKKLMEEKNKTTNEQERLKIQAEIGKLEEAKNSELVEMLKKDNLLQNSYREANLKNEKFTYEAKDTDSEYKKKLAEDFKKLANNSTRTHETFEMISKIAEDSNTNYSITNNEQLKKLGYDIDGKDVNGLVRVNKDGSQSVLINIDSKKAINRIVGHETTHILEGTKEYDEFKEFAKQYATTKGEYDSRLKSTKELYKGVKDANVENEVTADIVGDYLFTDTDFVNSLSVEKPTVFQKVKDLIDDLVVKVKGTKEEKQLREVQKKFKEAYRKISNTTTKQSESNLTTEADSNTTNNVKYSIIGLKNIDKALNNKNLDDNTKNSLNNVKNNYIKALSKEGKESNESIRRETGWFKDRNGDWKFEITDKYSKLKIIPSPNKTYKLGDILDHKLLYYVNPEIKNLEVKFKDLEGKRGQYLGIPVFEKIYLNNSLLNSSEQAIRSTLLHEIQHYNQRFNKFERGMSSGETLDDMIKYVNGLGEIEAKNVQERMNLSKDELKAIAPSSSTKNPIHPQAEQLIEKRKREIANKSKKSYNIFRGMFNEEDIGKTNGQNRELSIKTLGNGLKELDNSSFSLKQKQNEIIQKTNPVSDDYHTWIRNVDDIKTFEETLKDPDWSDYVEEGFNPDFTGDMIKEALNKGKITVYSSYPIEQGIFVSPSKMEAEIYSGNGKVYSKEVNLTDIAWIDPTQGQYAKVNDTKYSIQGLENYTKDEIKSISNDYIKEKLEENDLYDVEIKGIDIHGSRNRGTAKVNSDLDVVVEYDGDIREDILFDILNDAEDQLEIDGIKVDINPITADKTGTLEDYMKRSNEYDKEVLDKGNKYSLSENLPLENRVSGDELLDAQDLIDEVKSVGAQVDANGYVTVYHQTSNENAQIIKETGKMISKELDIFFSTSKDAQQSTGRGQTKLEFKIPAEKLLLDDIFSDNADVKIPLNGSRSLDVSNYLVTDYDTKYSLSNTDNQGRTLTKEQQEYFKDSKVRDENGNLLTMYHGTNNKFTIFDNSFIGKNTNNEGIFGKGFYFTEKKSYADYYNRKDGKVAKDGSGTTMEVYLDIKKPFYWNSIDTKEKMQAFIEETGMPKYVLNWNNTLKDQMMPLTEIKQQRKFREILEKNGYDGIIYKYDNSSGEYVVFDSNQIKNIDNTNPTDNPDIRYSMSDVNEQAVPSRNDVFGKDIKYQDQTTKQVEQAIAPLKEEVKTLTKEIQSIKQNDEFNTAPIPQDIVEQERREAFENIEDKDAPIEVEQNLPENEVTESKSLFETRDYEDVGKRSINAYQYDNPEVKPYFQDMARGMLQDLKNSTKGERTIDANVLYETNGESGIWGTKRDVPNDIADLLDGVDGKYKLSYKDIEKGLNAIIEDHGAENNVASKRIEFYLDQRLRNGYTDFFYGDVFEPNQEYLNLVSQDNRFNVEEQYNEWLKTLPNELPSDYAPYLEMAKEIVSNSPKTNEISSISNELDRINIIAPINEKAVKNNDSGYIPQDPTKESTYDEPSITNPVDAFLNKELTNRFEKRTKQTVISKQKGKSAFRDTMSYLFVNKNRAIDKFSDEVGNKNIKILADHVNNVFGEISTNISKVQTDNNGKAIGKGITEIFNQARKSKVSEAFDDYLFHKSNIERHKNGKGSVVPANDSARLVLEYDKTYPEFKTWGDEVNNFNKNNLYKQVDAGLITKELADNITNMYDFYVPFFENIERDYVKTDTGEITTRSAVKRAKGGADKNLLGFEKAMMKQTQNTISSIRKNQLYREIIDSTHNKQIGLDLNDGTFADENGYYLTAYEDGSQVSANISKELYDGLNNNLEQTVKDVEQKLSLITKPLQALSNVRRNLLTNWSPTFIITNPVKDFQDAPLNSKYAKDWAVNYPKALKELTTGKGEHLETFLNVYGQANLMGDYSIDSGISDITKSVKIKGKSKLSVGALNELAELTPRYAEYLASIKNGASQMEALYNAREVTTNFGRGGVITKALNRNGFTFLNASVQGFNKLYRNFSGENGAKGVVNASLKALSLGVAPALYNALMFGLGDDEDEDYKVLPDYIKDNYYLIKTDNGNFIRIPKGRMISVFGSAGRRTLELMQGEKDAFDGYLKNAYSQVGISNPMESNILAPLIQAYGSENGKTWYGTDIVPSRLQDVPKDEQYDESIDKLSIWLGEKTGISPYKANYVIDQYTGGIGDMILPTITEEAQSDSDSLLGTAIAPLKDKFTADSTTDNKYVSEFYTKNGELKVKANSSKATEEDLLVNQYMKSVSSEMGSLYSEMREVQANKNLSKSEKYKKAQAIKKQINELAEEGLNGYKNVNKTDNYAEVGGREFYKWTNDEGEVVWSKPDEAESDELNSMGLDIQEKSSYYTTKSKIYDIWDKYGDSDNYESKNKEIGQAIINSGLPDEAKYSLYDFSKGKYADTETTQALKLLDLDADTFISYASQTFKADKDSNGKSISGSKKKKVFDYINSMSNINFEQKVILAKLQYNNYDEWNYDIIDYLNNSSMTYEEMEFVLKQMGFKVKSDGTITWD